MSSEAENIPGDNELSHQKLMDYLAGNLPADEQGRIEKILEEPGLMSDAAEGLQQFKNINTLPHLAEQLNAGLKKQLQKKKQQRFKRRFKNEQWIYITIIVILTLIILCFIVIRQHLTAS